MINFILPSKKISWLLLTILFCYDNFLSYFAITLWHGREGNPIIAPYVEKYPLLYFLCIPGLIIMIYFIFQIIFFFAQKVLRRWNIIRELIEKVILAALVIYWGLANSSLNLLFMIGYRIPVKYSWPISTFIGISLSLIYSLLALNAIRNNHFKLRH